MSLVGPSRSIRHCNCLVAVGGITDIGTRWSGKVRLRLTLDRGRDASNLAPPAQSRTGPIRAYGLYGAFLVNPVSAQHDFLFLSSLSRFLFLGSTPAGSILSSRPHMSIAVARKRRDPVTIGYCSTKIRGEPAYVAKKSRHKLVFGWIQRTPTMKQSYASAARLRGGGSILPAALQP
jgi:hypothetical protein